MAVEKGKRARFLKQSLAEGTCLVLGPGHNTTFGIVTQHCLYLPHDKKKVGGCIFTKPWGPIPGWYAMLSQQSFGVSCTVFQSYFGCTQ